MKRSKVLFVRVSSANHTYVRSLAREKGLSMGQLIDQGLTLDRTTYKRLVKKKR